MESPLTLKQEIIIFLQSLPNIHDADGQRALIYEAGLDPELQGQIPLNQPPAQFVSILVETLIKYGKLSDGSYAIDAILQIAKRHIGRDKQKTCDELRQRLKKEFSEQPTELNGRYSKIPFSLIDKIVYYPYEKVKYLWYKVVGIIIGAIILFSGMVWLISEPIKEIPIKGSVLVNGEPQEGIKVIFLEAELSRLTNEYGNFEIRLMENDFQKEYRVMVFYKNIKQKFIVKHDDLEARLKFNIKIPIQTTLAMDENSGMTPSQNDYSLPIPVQRDMPVITPTPFENTELTSQKQEIEINVTPTPIMTPTIIPPSNSISPPSIDYVEELKRGFNEMKPTLLWFGKILLIVILPFILVTLSLIACDSLELSELFDGYPLIAIFICIIAYVSFFLALVVILFQDFFLSRRLSVSEILKMLAACILPLIPFWIGQGVLQIFFEKKSIFLRLMCILVYVSFFIAIFISFFPNLLVSQWIGSFIMRWIENVINI